MRGKSADSGRAAGVVHTEIPSRLDGLKWGRFHSLVLAALGITWILDGLEVTLAGSISGALQSSPTLHLSAAQVGLAGSLYVVGAVCGALVFGWLADRWGRRRLFNITIGLYLLATAATAFSSSFALYACFRVLTGAGIGGEYAAINSAIQELIPARYRGHTDLLVNGSFWIGAALGALGSVVLLEPDLLPPDMGWRACFFLGAVLGLVILYLRRFIPESPRWLMTHGRVAEGEQIVRQIAAMATPHPEAAPITRIALTDRPLRWLDITRTLFRTYPHRSLYAMVLMTSQAFFYNAIFFTYALVLGRFFGVPEQDVGWYMLPFAAGNFLGPLMLGRLFDTLGRRLMIALTYGTSGALLMLTAWLFVNGWLDATAQTVAWSVVFFFASAAASAAYLTVGESFPLEMRAVGIAIFYSLGTGLGGIVAPWWFGVLIGTGERGAIAGGYVFGAALMLIAATVTLWIGFAAERRPLEEVARPISCAEDP